MAKYVFRFIPSYALKGLLIDPAVSYVDTWFILYFTQQSFGFIESQIKAQNTDFFPIVPLLLCLLGVRVLSTVWNVFSNQYYIPRVKNKLTQKMQLLLYDKARTVDLTCYDDPEYYDNFTWSMQQSADRALISYGYLSQTLSVLTSLFAVGTVVSSLDWVSAVIIVAGVIVRFISDRKKIKVNYEKAVDINPVQRKIDYINRLFYLDKYAKEIRLNPIENFLLRKFDAAYDEKRRITLINARQNLKVDVFSTFSSNLLYQVLFYLVIGYRVVVEHSMTVTDMLVAETAILTVTERINSLVSIVDGLKESGQYIQKYLDFMNYEPRVTQRPDALPLTTPVDLLSFRNVSFRYRDDAPEVLKNISFDIHKNEKLAIVGYNGAGKSTLIKLMMRLYEPTGGALAVNGKDVHEVTITSYRNKFGAVFQDFKLFSLTLAENVWMARDPDRVAVMRALEKANFADKLARLPAGLDTMLTREFDEDGTLLSGGEQQKVAIARVFAGGREIVIMDEPSSALDVDSEYELNQLMINSMSDKTVIFISHRLSTTRFADRILMMANGQIIEQGSHEQLMKLNGKYAEMFNKQAEKYLQT